MAKLLVTKTLSDSPTCSSAIDEVMLPWTGTIIWSIVRLQKQWLKLVFLFGYYVNLPALYIMSLLPFWFPTHTLPHLSPNSLTDNIKKDHNVNICNIFQKNMTKFKMVSVLICGMLMWSFSQIQSLHYGPYLCVFAQIPLLLHSICFLPSSLFMCNLPSCIPPSSPFSTPLTPPRLEWMGSSPALSFSGYLETCAIDTPSGSLSRDGWVFCCN